MNREQYENYQLAERHREQVERTSPFIKAKADLMGLMLPVLIIHADDPFVHYIYSPEQQAVLDAMDQLIRSASEAR